MPQRMGFLEWVTQGPISFGGGLSTPRRESGTYPFFFHCFFLVPCVSAVSRTSSSSIFSRVVRASSSTSAAVRPLVGMGSRTT